MSEKNLTKEEANKLLTKTLDEAKAKISECEEIAEEYGLEFSSPIDAYGMGEWYRSKKSIEKENEEYDEEDRIDADEDSGWVSSSSSC